MNLFDIFDDFFVPETEEIRKKREELTEARRKALEDYRKKSSSQPAFLSLGGSPDDFKGQVQSIQERYPECRVESEDMEFDNGYFRKVKIKCEKEE